jgi:hypothetical protein
MLQIVQTVTVGRLLSALHTHKCLSSIRQKSLPVSVARWSACGREIWGSYDGDGCLLATRCFILFLTSLIRGDTMIKRIYVHVAYMPCRNSSDRWTALRDTCVLSCLRLVCGSLNLLPILFCGLKYVFRISVFQFQLLFPSDVRGGVMFILSHVYRCYIWNHTCHNSCEAVIMQ